MKILLAGALGFIGGHLLERLLEDGNEVVGVDNLSIHEGETPKWAKKVWIQENTIILTHDITKMYQLGPDFDVVINAAVLPLPHSLEFPLENFRTNTEITMSCIEHAIKNKARLVQISSSEVYGTASEEKMSEAHRRYPTTTYAAAKLACDALCLSMAEQTNLDVVIARPFNTIGERQNEGSYAAIVPATIRRIMEGKRPVIYGDGSTTRDYTYVGDVVDGIVKVMEEGISKTEYNLCSGVETKTIDIVNMIAKEMGYKGEYDYWNARPGDVLRHRGENTRAKVRLGWIPKTSIEEAIRRAVNGGTIGKRNGDIN